MRVYKKRFGYLIFIGCLYLLSVPVNVYGEQFISILYHEVAFDVEGDMFAVDVRSFIEQMEYLRTHNYHPVSLDDIIAAKDKVRPLPENPVLITVDDGTLSFYETIFPILKLYKYPAVLAIVVSWVEHGYHVEKESGNKKTRQIEPLTWEQVREIADSGLVEIVSHSYDLHKGVIYNPQGNESPVGSSFAYDPETKRYEDQKDFRRRIREDLKRSVNLIKKRLGRSPRIMVWPYGEFNKIGMEEAEALGMSINLSVVDGFTDTDDLRVVNRGIVMGTMDISDFASALKLAFIPQDPIRAVQVDLDMIYDPDPEQQESNLGHLLDRLLEIDANTVYLQAFSDLDGDGNVSELYFPNRVLPMRADLFNRAAHQIRTRTPVTSVYAWMPLLSFQLPDSKDLLVRKNINGTITPVDTGYKRLSPFSSKTLEKVGRIYEDLSMHANITGVLFQDDAYLNDFEDFHPDALSAYEAEFGYPLSIEKVKADPDKLQKWTDFKTGKLMEFSEKIAGVVKRYRPNVKIARNIYARLLTEPKSETWFAQDYRKFLYQYDNVVVMAYPYMEKEEEPLQWLKRLTQIAGSYPDGFKKTVFKLQTYNWNRNEWVSQTDIKDQVYQLVINGARHIAYYPDDYRNDKPAVKEIKKVISLNASPFTPGFLQ